MGVPRTTPKAPFVQCAETHPVDAHVRCESVYRCSKPEHKGQHHAGAVIWGMARIQQPPQAPKYRNPGAHLPSKPAPLIRALAASESTIEVLRAIQRAFTLLYDEARGTNVDTEWLYGLCAAEEILDSAIDAFGEKADLACN